MPRQWKLIALYMLLAYAAFVTAINIAKHQVIADERAAVAPPTTPSKDLTKAPKPL